MKRIFPAILAYAALVAASPASGQTPATPTTTTNSSSVTPTATATPTPYAPPAAITSIAPVTLDTADDMVGIAEQTAAAKGLQARIMWIDAGANVGSLNSPEKIADIVDHIKKAGFNMIVVDVKPIVGDTIYPSKYAPKLTEWKGQTTPKDLDVLKYMLDDAHAAGLTVYANMSTFGEGHKYVGRGLGYTHPSWQTTMYLTDRSVSENYGRIEMSRVDALPSDENSIAAVTKDSLLRHNLDGYEVAILNFDARVQGIYDGTAFMASPVPIPPAGFALVGRGDAGKWLQQHAAIDQIVLLGADPKYVPVSQDNSGAQLYTIFVDPINPEVRAHELDIVKEVVTNYSVDGIIFDDRLRYAGVNADFGPASRAAFEAYVGHKLTWPDDIYRDSLFPNQPPTYGPYFQKWIEWRAGNITSWLKEAADAARAIRPSIQMSVYVGSWYDEYYLIGSNWASPDFSMPFSWDTPAFRAAAYADNLDWLATGCYYLYPSIADATPAGTPGQSVEAAAQLSNRVVDDAAWTYAGLYVLSYKDRPATFERAIRAAMGSSQGVMIFDMSQIVQYNWWDQIADAFGPGPVPTAPNTVPGLLDTVRAQHAADVASGKPQPPLPSYQGLAGAGL